MISDTLEQIEKKLPRKDFMRIHRSHLINLNFVDEIKVHRDKKYSVLLSDYYELELPVIRSLIQDLKKRLGL